MIRSFLCTLLLLPWLGVAEAAEEWKMVPADSRLQFIITYEKQAAPGVFKQFDTRLKFDAERPAASQLVVIVAIPSADMDSAEVNDGIRAPEWFDFAGFPQAEFRASDIRRTDAGRYVARGTLKLKGVQREVAVPFTWARSGDTATMEGDVTLNRLAFNVGTGEWAAGDVIGLDVKVKFKVKLRKAG